MHAAMMRADNRINNIVVIFPAFFLIFIDERLFRLNISDSSEISS